MDPKDEITKLIKKSELALRFSLSLLFHFLYFVFTQFNSKRQSNIL